jgi:hypothetical protein
MQNTNLMTARCVYPATFIVRALQVLDTLHVFTVYDWPGFVYIVRRRRNFLNYGLLLLHILGVWSSLIIFLTFFVFHFFIWFFFLSYFLVLKQLDECIIRHVFPIIYHVLTLVFYVIVFVFLIFFVKSLLLILCNWRSIHILIQIFHIRKSHISEPVYFILIIWKFFYWYSWLFTYFVAWIILIFVFICLRVRILKNINIRLAIRLDKLWPEKLFSCFKTSNCHFRHDFYTIYIVI